MAAWRARAAIEHDVRSDNLAQRIEACPRARAAFERRLSRDQAPHRQPRSSAALARDQRCVSNTAQRRLSVPWHEICPARGGMDPQPLSSADWLQLSRLLIYLFLFTGLGLTAALGFLLGHAVIPSLVQSHDAPASLGAMRWIAYPLSAAALVLTLYALVRALSLAGDVMQRVYPRFWI
jgi:hypothetical protein